MNCRRIRVLGRVASIGLLGAIILALGGCSEEYNVAVGLSDGDVVVVVPSCFDGVSVIELATREIQNNRVEFSTVWRLEALTPDEQIDTVTAGRDVAGFTTAHHLIEMPESELVVFVDSVEPGPSASAVFRLSELRDDQLLFDGEYGTKEDFERAADCGAAIVRHHLPHHLHGGTSAATSRGRAAALERRACSTPMRAFHHAERRQLCTVCTGT